MCHLTEWILAPGKARGVSGEQRRQGPEAAGQIDTVISSRALTLDYAQDSCFVMGKECVAFGENREIDDSYLFLQFFIGFWRASL